MRKTDTEKKIEGGLGCAAIVVLTALFLAGLFLAAFVVGLGFHMGAAVGS